MCKGVAKSSKGKYHAFLSIPQGYKIAEVVGESY